MNTLSSNNKQVTIAIVLSLVVCVLTAVMGDVLHRRSLRKALDADADYLRRQLNRNVTTRHFRALAALAGSPLLLDYLQNPVEDRRDVLGALIGAQQAMGADFAYLMNADGTVVACSPYGNGNTLTGKNFKFRPYFLRAWAGKECLYGALGVATNRRGFYFSVPVVSETKEVKLVLVAKIGLEAVDHLLQNDHYSVVLKTPSGVVFSSNPRRWLFKVANRLSDDQFDRIRESKQFAGEPLEPLPFSLKGEEFQYNGVAQMAAKAEIGVPGWELIVWKPYSFPLTWALIYGSAALLALWSVLVVVHAVRRRREIQQRLMLSQQDYEAIFNASADAIFIHDPDTGVILEVNERTCDLYGGTPSDFIGKSVESITSGESEYTVEQAANRIADVLDGKRTLFEWHARRLDGSLFWAEVNLTVMQLRGEKRVIAVVRNVTERHEHVDRLRKLSRAIEESPASVVITDAEGKIEYVNKAFCRVTGFPSEEVIGKNNRLLSSGKHPKSYYKELWNTIKSGKIWTGEICNAKRDKSLFWELSRIAPILDKDGQPTHFVAVKVDISDLKETQEKLGQAKRAAEDADRAKSTFLANMSHEIRTPMNAIIGFLDLTLRDELSETVRSNLEVVSGSANELMGLIDNILDTSKLESGKMLLEDAQFDLKNVLDEVAALFSPKAKEKDLSFQTVVSGTFAPAYVGDRGKLKQILSNLIGNAIKFTPSGSVTVTVEPRGDDRVQFEVRDTGIGIPAHKLDSIFAPFSQCDESTTRRFGGTGLGTTISRQLVQLMGGEIWVRSEDGKGSEFSFEIPLLPIATRVRPKRSTDDSPGGAVPDSRPLTILMAEDVAANVALARQWFKHTNHLLEVARDGLEAVDAFKRLKPDVVLMDVHMPRMDGVEAAREIRRCDASGKVVIIALTASVMKEEVDNYLASGMDAVIGKPIDFRMLFDQLARLTDGAIDAVDGAASSGRELAPANCPEVLKEMIDWSDALERWGDMGFFLESFEKFIDDQMATFAALKEALADGDMDEARDRAHSLKGVLGNLSLTICFEQAKRLERLIADGDERQLKYGLDDLGASLQKAVDAARSLD